MNSPEHATPPGPEFEAKVTALLLGELAPAEADEVRRALELNPELSKLHAQLKQTIELVREAERRPAEAASSHPAQTRLSAERREQLLERFKVIAPPELAARKPARISWQFAMGMAAALILLLSVAGLSLIPALARPKTKGMAEFRSLLRLNTLEALGVPATPAPPAARAAAVEAQVALRERAAESPLAALQTARVHIAYLRPALEPKHVELAAPETARVNLATPRNSTDLGALEGQDAARKSSGIYLPAAEQASQPTATTTAGASAPQAVEQAGRGAIALSENALGWSFGSGRAKADAPGGMAGGFGGGRGGSAPTTGGVVPLMFGDGLGELERLAEPAQDAYKRLVPVLGDGPQIGQLMAGRAPADTTFRELGQAAPDQAAADHFAAVAGKSEVASVQPVQAGVEFFGKEVSDLNAIVPLNGPVAGIEAQKLQNERKAKAPEVPSPAMGAEAARGYYRFAGAAQGGGGGAVPAPSLATTLPVVEMSEAAPPGAQAVDESRRDGPAPGQQLGLMRYGLLRGASPPSRGLGGEGKAAEPEQDAKALKAVADSELARERVLSEKFQKEKGLEVAPQAPALDAVERLGRMTLRKQPRGLSLDGAKVADARASAAGVKANVKGDELRKEARQAGSETKDEGRSDFLAAAVKVEAVEAKPVAADDAAVTRRPAPAAEPQPEVLTTDNWFSTFSLNVTDVSFKLASASLEKGLLPEPATVRSEEFINAFDYRDPEPPPGRRVGLTWERARYPFAHNRELLRLAVRTAARGREPGRPLNLVLLLDNSGSMERADRVQIIRAALAVLAAQFQAQDRISVVAFARTARLWVDGLPGARAGELVALVGNLTPEGGTNLGDALDAAYQTAVRHHLAQGNNRVVLLTDGAANLGDVSPDSLKQKVEANRKRGIALDCFGIGWEGYNDDLLEVLARHGDGRYGFINTPEAAATDFAAQLAGALQVAAADVKVQVEFNPQRVTAYRQVGYAKHQLTKEQFRDNTVDAAELGAAESGNALYILEVNPQGVGALGWVRVRYRIPATGQVEEQEWPLAFTGGAVSFQKATPALRLAGVAAAFAEWLVSSPFAASVDPDALLGYLGGVPDAFGLDPRPKRLEWSIRQAKSIRGR
jgi:Mg-chelatase subunit ChlD